MKTFYIYTMLVIGLNFMSNLQDFEGQNNAALQNCAHQTEHLNEELNSLRIKFSTCNDNLSHLQSVQGNVTVLQQQLDEANKKNADLENRMVEFNNLKNQNNGLNERVHNMEHEMEHLRQENSSLKVQINTLGQENNGCKMKLSELEHLRADLHSCNDNLSHVNMDLQKVSQENLQNKKQVEILRGELDSCKRQNEEDRNTISNGMEVQNQLRACQNHVNQMGIKLNSCESQRKSLNERFDHQMTDLNECRSKMFVLNSLKNSNARLESQLKMCNSKILDMQNNVNKLNGKVASCGFYVARLEQCDGRTKSLESEIGKCNSHVNMLNVKITNFSQVTSKITFLESENGNLKKTIQTINSQILECQGKNHQFQHEISHLRMQLNAPHKDNCSSVKLEYENRLNVLNSQINNFKTEINELHIQVHSNSDSSMGELKECRARLNHANMTIEKLKQESVKTHHIMIGATNDQDLG